MVCQNGMEKICERDLSGNAVFMLVVKKIQNNHVKNLTNCLKFILESYTI